MRAALLLALASCVGSRAPVWPHYEPVYFSPVDGQWHVTPICDGLPMVDRNGVIGGCLGNWRTPLYECAAEDGSGRTVTAAYRGDPADLSERYADEPGGLWSCYPAPREQSSASAGSASRTPLTDLSNAPFPCSLNAICLDSRSAVPSQELQDALGVPPVPAGCESPNAMPTVNCLNGAMEYDGCHWSCVRFFEPSPSSARQPTTQPTASATDVFTDLELAASADHGAACNLSGWAPIPAALEACE